MLRPFLPCDITALIVSASPSIQSDTMVDFSSMREVKRLDEVFTFGDTLSFVIPHEWIEGDAEDEGTYLYHYPNTDSGWLRVSLITLRRSRDPAERIHEFFRRKENYWVDEETENFVHSYEKDIEQDGDLLHIYYWHVGNFVLPDVVHEAIFSYTILRAQVNDESNRQMISVLSQVLPRSRFLPGTDQAGRKPN